MNRINQYTDRFGKDLAGKIEGRLAALTLTAREKMQAALEVAELRSRATRDGIADIAKMTGLTQALQGTPLVGRLVDNGQPQRRTHSSHKIEGLRTIDVY